MAMDTLVRDDDGSISQLMRRIGLQARAAAITLASASTESKNYALRQAAANMRGRAGSILAANAQDLAAGRAKGMSKAMLDRLTLDEERIEAMAKGLEDVAALPDPVGTVMAEWDRPNGLHISRVRTPLGVVGLRVHVLPAGAVFDPATGSGSL